MNSTISGLEVNNLHKGFGDTFTMTDITLKVKQGDILAVLGPSGCGKSTLLAIIAGLVHPDQGNVIWNGKPIGDIPAHKRNFGLMFQDLALFPHRDVFRNVAFGLQMARLPRAEIERRVRETLELVGLPGYENRDVNTLSGGESQRVALARSLAPQPRLLMLDEPLGSLDRHLRERLVQDLRRILLDSQQTAIYVTHDQEEAFAIADSIVIMNAGRIEQTGTPQAIYWKPANPFVARFLGLDNLLTGIIQRGPTGPQVQTQIGSFPLNGDFMGRVTVLIRPDRVRLSSEGKHLISGVVRETSFRGSECRAVIQVKSALLRFDFDSDAPLPGVGEPIILNFEPEESIQIFPGEIKDLKKTGDENSSPVRL